MLQPNIDSNSIESLLLHQHIDPSLKIPVVEQVLQIAVYDELHTLDFCSKVLEKFGEIEPFSQVISEERYYHQILLTLCEKYRVTPPINKCYESLVVPNELSECCEIAVAMELDSINLYEHLISYVEHADIRDILYKLQAAAYNNHLPAFRSCVAQFMNNSVQSNAQAQPDLQNIYQQHGHHKLEEIFSKVEKYRPLLESIQTGKLDQQALGSLLQETNLSLIGGMLVGGLAVMTLDTLRQESSNKEKRDGK